MGEWSHFCFEWCVAAGSRHYGWLEAGGPLGESYNAARTTFNFATNRFGS
jgi:hypothetical protein